MASRFERMRESEKKKEENNNCADGLMELEESCQSELTETQASFRKRMNEENKRFRDVCDTEYWFCVCFTSRAQREELVRRLGLPDDVKYYDGREFAKVVNRALATPDIEFPKVKAFDKDYQKLTE